MRAKTSQEGDEHAKQEAGSRKQEESGTDAITLLKQDREQVRKMFEEFEKADEDRKFELATEICQALSVHATIEEEIFYPQVREAIDAEDLMLEAELQEGAPGADVTDKFEDEDADSDGGRSRGGMAARRSSDDES